MAAAGYAQAASTEDESAALLISGRIDRLPLTRVHWELAILVEITWGFIIVDTDGIGARLYPFVWRPLGLITNNQYAVIQALQVGLGDALIEADEILRVVTERLGARHQPHVGRGPQCGERVLKPLRRGLAVDLGVRLREE